MWFQIPLLNFHSLSNIISYGRDRPQHTHWIIFSLSLIWAALWLHSRSIIYLRIRRKTKKIIECTCNETRNQGNKNNGLRCDECIPFITERWAWQESDRISVLIVFSKCHMHSVAFFFLLHIIETELRTGVRMKHITRLVAVSALQTFLSEVHWVTT